MTANLIADLAAAAGIFFAGTAFGFVLGYRETRLVHGLIEARMFDDATDWTDLVNPPPPHHHSEECAPDCVAAEPARRGTTPTDPEAPAGPFPTGRKVAQPNYQALGLGSAEEAEGRN